jgi:hypothetical protein
MWIYQVNLPKFRADPKHHTRQLYDTLKQAFPMGTPRENHVVFWWHTGEMVNHQKTTWFSRGKLGK